jgi:hypothetical protein
MNSAPGKTQAEVVETHRRETLLRIVLPVAAGLVALIVIVLLSMIALSSGQRSVMADVLATVLILCPMAICFLPLALGLVALAFLMNKVHDGTENVMGKALNLSEVIYHRVDRNSEKIARRMIDFSAKIAPFEKLVLGAFDRRPPTIITEAKKKDDQ